MNGQRPQQDALIVMARLPRQGQVKRRLAATVGEQAATELYRLTAERLFAESRALPVQIRRYLFYAGAADVQPFREWAGDAFHFERQRGPDLGHRLAHAFETVFAQRAQKAVVVGSDIPDLSAELVKQAFHLLDHYPLVIGPDHGGGYYLLGMKMLYGDLFLRRLTWGTERVYGETLRIMRALDLVPAVLPQLIDVDLEGDLRRWLERGPISRQQETLAQLARHILG
ncbi:MAG: TIGR04282 family arsenosugar biosynthesis glycosyltransferase [Candidatus Promineifilaceae bacterium]|nr:TIGR04282 family arsenosugar biosynthesis glycosyltransferase [Candidatus Promineifilaceae bacterium]